MLPRVVESATVRPVPSSASTRFGKRGRSEIRASLAVSRARPKHNGAAFMAYRARSKAQHGGTSMRLIVGIIIGCALTVGGAYIADTVSAAGAKPVMVNWDVVAKNLDSVTTLARAGWKRIAG